MSTIEKRFSDAAAEPQGNGTANLLTMEDTSPLGVSEPVGPGLKPELGQPQISQNGINAQANMAPVTEHYLEPLANKTQFPTYFEIPDEKPSAPKPLNPFKRFLKDLWRAPDLLLAGGVGAAVFAWVAIYAFTAYQPQFVSNAKVMIKDSAMTANYVLNPQTTGAVQTTSSNASNPVLNMMGLLSSSEVKDQLWAYFRTQRPDDLKKLKIKDKADWDDYFSDGSKLIKAKNIVGTDLITLQLGWTDPKTSQQALTVLVKAFQDTSRSINQAEQKNRSEYLAKQVNVITGKLKTVREQKARFKRQMGSVNLLRESDDLAHTRIETETALNLTLARAQGRTQETARFQSMLGGLNTNQALAATGVGLDPSMNRLQDQLYTLKQQLADSTSMLTDRHPRVKELQAQIAAVSGQIAQEKSRTVGGMASGGMAVADTTRGKVIELMSTEQADGNNLVAQAKTLRSRLADLDRQLAAYPAVEEGLTNLEQDERALSSALDTLRQKQIEAQLKEAETMSNVVVVDQPNMPSNPKFPTINHLLIIGALLGLGSGAGILAAKRRYFLSAQGGKPGSVGMLWFDLPGALDNITNPGKQVAAPQPVAGHIGASAHPAAQAPATGASDASPSESANIASAGNPNAEAPEQVRKAS